MTKVLLQSYWKFHNLELNEEERQRRRGVESEWSRQAGSNCGNSRLRRSRARGARTGKLGGRRRGGREGGMGGREKPRAASTQKLDPAGRAAASASVRASTAIRRPPFLTLVASDKWAAFMAPLARKPHSHRDINIWCYKAFLWDAHAFLAVLSPCLCHLVCKKKYFCIVSRGMLKYSWQCY